MKENEEKITKQLQSRKERLEKVVSSKEPKNREFQEKYEMRVKNACIYIRELEELEEMLEFSDVELHIVTKRTFERLCEKADFATSEFDGFYCKVVAIKNFPYEEVWIIYMAGMDTI